MREKIHPEYHQAKVRCACGHEFVVGSTSEELRVDICSSCHPFFTGKQKFVDTAGRVDKYFRKYGEEAQRKYKKKRKKRQLTEEERLALESAEAEAPEAEAEASEAPVIAETKPEAEPRAEAPQEQSAESTPEAPQPAELPGPEAGATTEPTAEVAQQEEK